MIQQGKNMMARQSLIRVCIVLRVAIFLSLTQAELSAHFLFIRIGEHAEAGRGVEVFFSERAAAGDPRFTQKIATTELWMQHPRGKFELLKTQQATDRLRGLLPAAGTVSVTGKCEYGVLEREVPFLLRYYPKAIAGTAGDLNQLAPHDKLPLEIKATIDEGTITLTLIDHGKPVPKAVFTTVDDSLSNEELTADADGKVTWKPNSAGHYCVYTKVVRKTAGELNGKKYTEIREFSTLAFEWPLGRTDGDPAAIELFEKAIASRAQWRDFPGFAAQIEGDFDGRPFTGRVQIDKKGSVELKIDQEVAESWVEDQLRSIVLHRLESPRQSPPVLRFADQDAANPLGRLLTYVGGKFASSYRVQGDQLRTVNRNLGSENMTITVLENDKTAEGKYLPHLYNVQYWDASTGNLLRTESFENRWQRVGSWDLPALNTLMTSSSAGLSVRSFRLTKHEIP